MYGLQTLGPSPEEAEILDTLVDQLDRFGAERLDARVIDREKHVDRAIVDDMAEMGLFGLTIPEEFGGVGFGLAAAGDAIATLAKYDRSVATTLGLHLGLGTRGLVRFGSDDLQQDLLPRLAEGSEIAAFAATEANAGSDLMSIATKAMSDGAGNLVVDGEKVYVTNGGMATVFTVLAATPGLAGARTGHSLLLIEKSDGGIEVGAEEDKLGLRGSSTTTVAFDGTTIPEGRIIGEPSQGMKHVEHVLAWGRTAMAAGCCGTGKQAIDVTARYVQERKQFGKAIAAFPVVKNQIADMAALHFAMKGIVLLTAARESDDLALAYTSLAAKVLCSEGAGELCDVAIQLHGGAGFIEETGVPLMMRDSRITRIFEGANDVLLARAGSLIIMAPPPREALATTLDGEIGALAARADEISGRVDGFREALKQRHKIRVVRKQRLLHRLGRAALFRESCDAAVLKAYTDPTPLNLALASHWLDMAEVRMAPSLVEPEDDTLVEFIAEATYERVAP